MRPSTVGLNEGGEAAALSNDLAVETAARGAARNRDRDDEGQSYCSDNPHDSYLSLSTVEANGKRERKPTRIGRARATPGQAGCAFAPTPSAQEVQLPQEYHGRLSPCAQRERVLLRSRRDVHDDVAWAKAASSAQPNGCELLGGRGDGSYQRRYRYCEPPKADGSRLRRIDLPANQPNSVRAEHVPPRTGLPAERSQAASDKRVMDANPP